MAMQLLLTCEHAGKHVPPAYRFLFDQAGHALESHRGWDPGALSLARRFQRHCPGPLFFSTVTRLLVEPNRSLHHRRLFSEFSAPLPAAERQDVLRRYYHGYRQPVERWLERRCQPGRRVVHVSFHTFTPVWEGRPRTADIGLLYDPRRPWEKALATAWQNALRGIRPEINVRRNYPYHGKADGFTTHLRGRWGRHRYAGLELEVNQQWTSNRVRWLRLADDLASAFLTAQAAPVGRQRLRRPD